MIAISSAEGTLFKYKYEKKQDLINHLKGNRALSQGYDNTKLAQFGTGSGGYFGFPGYDLGQIFAFKQTIPVPYPVPISNPIPIPHPVPFPITKTIPVTVDRPYAVPIPAYHFAKAFNGGGDYGLSAYEAALANYASLHQQNHYANHYQNHHNHHGPHSHSPATYEPDCHPYCDINLPQGSSPVPLTMKVKELMPKQEKEEETATEAKN